MRIILAVMAAVFLLFPAGCGRSPGIHSGRIPDSLQVVRHNAFQKIQPVPPLDVTIGDARVVQGIYAALLAIPPASRFPGVYHCPVDWGISYRLTFLHGQTVVLSAAADPGG